MAFSRQNGGRIAYREDYSVLSAERFADGLLSFLVDLRPAELLSLRFGSSKPCPDALISHFPRDPLNGRGSDT